MAKTITDYIAANQPPAPPSPPNLNKGKSVANYRAAGHVAPSAAPPSPLFSPGTQATGKTFQDYLAASHIAPAQPSAPSGGGLDGLPGQTALQQADSAVGRTIQNYATAGQSAATAAAAQASAAAEDAQAQVNTAAGKTIGQYWSAAEDLSGQP